MNKFCLKNSVIVWKASAAHLFQNFTPPPGKKPKKRGADRRLKPTIISPPSSKPRARAFLLRNTLKQKRRNGIIGGGERVNEKMDGIIISMSFLITHTL